MEITLGMIIATIVAPLVRISLVKKRRNTNV